MHKKAPYPRGFFYSQIIQINKNRQNIIFGGFYLFSVLLPKFIYLDVSYVRLYQLATFRYREFQLIQLPILHGNQLVS